MLKIPANENWAQYDKKTNSLMLSSKEIKSFYSLKIYHTRTWIDAKEKVGTQNCQFFFRSVNFFSLIWKNGSFSHVSYLCLKVSYLERIFSMCTHQTHMVFYFELWGIFKSAFFWPNEPYVPDVHTYCCLIAVHYKSMPYLSSVINWMISHHFLIMFLISRNFCI